MTISSRPNMISIVVPCYNEEASIPIFIDAMSDVIEGMISADSSLSFELVMVDDGSSDGTLQELRHVGVRPLPFAMRWISFSRNFGKEAALYAGLEAAHGGWVATMDADMQDPPSLLPEMWRYASSGDWDCIATCRRDRAGEPPVRSAFARAFYRIINRLSDADIVDGARDFRLMSRSVVNAVLSLGEINRFTKGIYGWVGFRTKWIAYENVERAAGETKWSFFSLFRYALDGITAFSTAPLAFASLLGTIICALAVLFGAFVVLRALMFGDPVAGWPSLMAVVLFLGGAQLLCIGIIGQYLAKTYLEVKHRPIYIVGESSDDLEAPVKRPAHE